MISLTAITVALLLGWSLKKAWMLAAGTLAAKPGPRDAAGAR